MIEKRFKTKIEAKKYELELQNKIDKIHSGDSVSLENSVLSFFQISIKTFGGNPTKQVRLLLLLNHLLNATIVGTEIAFRKHILPLLGNYSIDFLIKISKLY